MAALRAAFKLPTAAKQPFSEPRSGESILKTPRSGDRREAPQIDQGNICGGLYWGIIGPLGICSSPPLSIRGLLAPLIFRELLALLF